MVEQGFDLAASSQGWFVTPPLFCGLKQHHGLRSKRMVNMANCSLRTKTFARSLYWQLKISNRFVTFAHQPTPAVVSHFRCVRRRQPRGVVLRSQVCVTWMMRTSRTQTLEGAVPANEKIQPCLLAHLYGNPVLHRSEIERCGK